MNDAHELLLLAVLSLKAEAVENYALVQSWPEILRLAGESGLRADDPAQFSLI